MESRTAGRRLWRPERKGGDEGARVIRLPPPAGAEPDPWLASERPAELTDELIHRLYDVAMNPLRYEALIDWWEATIGPRARGMAAAVAGAPPIEGHVARAGQVLDQAIEAASKTRLRRPRVLDPALLLRRMEPTAAFAVDSALHVTHANEAARAVLGVGPGDRLAGLALAEGEARALSQAAGRLFQAEAARPAVLRVRAARTNRLVVLHLQLVRPGVGTEEAAAGEPFVVAAASELGWPAGFSEVLRAAFDLTPAEGEVVRALAEGATLSEIAAARGRSVETVRAQLKAIMAKTETRSQAELVRLTLSTMEMAHVWEEACKELAPVPAPMSAPVPAPLHTSRGTGSLEPRPFRSLRLPDGRRLDYLLLGDPAGRPVLFFPLDLGLVRWPASAEAEAARLGLRIVVPVRPGFGRSDPLPRGTPAGAYAAQVADDLARLLDHLGHGRVPLLSLGSDSFFAAAFHAAHPERVRALVACAGVLPLTRPEQYERMDKWHRFILAGGRYTPRLLPFLVKAGFALARRLGKRGFVQAVYGQSPADVATFEDPEVFEAMTCGAEVALSDTHSAHDAFAREVVSQEGSDWSGSVAALRGSVPVHFLNGLQDPQVPPGTLAEFQEDHPWIEFRVWPDAGQLLFFAKWREVLPLLDRYAT